MVVWPGMRVQDGRMPGVKLRGSNGLWYAILGAWLAAMVVGGGYLWRYKLTPTGGPSGSPENWPAASMIPLATDRATLVMLAHPKCPCTSASVGELSRLLTDTHNRADAHVLVVRPPGAPEQWEQTGLWDRLAAIPGVTVHADIEGKEARRFGATVSGHVVIYEPAGRLLFQGGITGARGHEGENPGRSQARSAIMELLADGKSPTFGCDLLSAEEIARVSDDEQIDRR